MKLEAVTISGFRGYGEPLTVSIEGSTTTIIGRNDAGKSSVFEALDIFFGGSKPEVSDFTIDSSEPLEISCTFTDLPPAVVLDVNRSTTLQDEYLVDTNGRLTLVKSWTRSKLTAPSIYALANHPSFQTDLDPLNAKLPALKAEATRLGIPNLEIDDRRASSAYRSAIWKTTIASGTAVLVEKKVALTSEDGKSVAAALSSYLPVFHLFKADRQGNEADKVAQDPAAAVIKAVLAEHEDTLEELSQTVQSQVESMLGEVVRSLSDVAPKLAKSLSINDPAPVWSKAFSGLQFFDENGVPLSKRGSGTRRLVLLSFFRATAEKGLLLEEDDSNSYHRGVITAVEEPETALHADLQTDIISSLQDVGDLPHRQVLLTTHSANLIRLVPANSIRYITVSGPHKRSCISVESDGNATALLGELNRSLGIFTDHNVRCFILVEGRNDIAALRNLSAACEREGISSIRSLASMEAAGLVCFMPIGGGGSASLWESTLSPFRRYEVHIMDSDRESPDHALKQSMQDLKDRADEKRLVYILNRREMENYLTREAVEHAFADVPGFNSRLADRTQSLDWDYIDIPSVCADVVHEIGTSSDKRWAELTDTVRKKKESNAKKRLNEAFSHNSVCANFEPSEADLFEALSEITRLAELKV